MTRHSDQIRDEFGRPIPGATIYVYDAEEALDTLTDDDDVALDNPLTSDEFGQFYFNAADGLKYLHYYFGGQLRYKEEVLVGDVPGYMEAAEGFADAAEAFAAAAAIAEAAAAVQAALAAAYAETALSMGNTYNTKADATADLANIDADAYVLVLADETGGGRRVIYRKSGGALVARATLPGSALATIDDLADIAVPLDGQVEYVAQDGRAAWRKFIDDDLSAEVTADPGQGVYTPPASDTDGSSGAWKVISEAPLTPNRFYEPTDPNFGAAMTRAIAYLKTTATPGYGYSRASERLLTPRGIYDLGSTTLDFDHAMIFEGESPGGFGQAGGTVFTWDAGVTGIRNHYGNTTGATGDGAGDGLASPSIIFRNFTMYGTFSGTESEAHGIQLRGHGVVRDVGIFNFAGDAIYSKTNLGAAGLGYLGASNGSEISNVTLQGCRNGLYLEEADSNAWVINNPLIVANRRYGVWGKTTLGSTINGGVLASNGMTQDFPSMVSHGGNYYFMLPNQEVWAKANAPSGTTAKNQGWVYFGPGAPTAAIPAWAVDVDVRDGGAMRLESSYEQWMIVGVYQEQDSAPAFIANTCQAVVLSPLMAQPLTFDGTPYGADVKGSAAGILVGRGVIAGNATEGITRIGGLGSGNHIYMTTPGGLPHFVRSEGGYLKHLVNGFQSLAINETTGKHNNIDLEPSSTYKVNAVPVVGARRTGWAVPTGTATRTTFDTATVTTAQLAERVFAIIQDINSTSGHGLIGP